MIFIDCRRSKEGMEAATSMGAAMLSSFAAPIAADALPRYSILFSSSFSSIYCVIFPIT
jgi:hypothetical protein